MTDYQDPGNKVTILGVGNILLKDEGVGVRLVQRLVRKYRFPPHAEAVDGGTLGLNLLSVIAGSHRLVVIDAIKNGGQPGQTYRFLLQDLPYALRAKNSLHQADLMEALALAELIGRRPQTVILGVEPQDISPWGLELTPPVEASLDRLEAMVLAELKQWGVKPEPLQPDRAHHCHGPCLPEPL